MYLGEVVGSVTSTYKHPAYHAMKLLLVRLTDAERRWTGRSMVAVDAVGAGVGERVLVCSDGQAVADWKGWDRIPPVREIVVGIVDKVELR
ncbi:MAG TPA: EutN/CcmL family microcompartment protein [Acidobacteriota bacterium]|nr:EutN/CcmL family microcompartment protein [Acidobacteriota bacterium]